LVNEDPAHYLRCDSKEVGSILPVGISLINEPEVCFVDKRCGLECMPSAFPNHIVMGQPSQFVINPGNQFFQRLLIAFAPTL
jgi:hypothetical protein